VVSPVRIVFLLDELAGPDAGTERQLLELVAGLDRRRFDPSLTVLRPTPYIQRRPDLPCASEILDVYRLRSPISWRRLAGFGARLRASTVQVVHIFFPDASIVAPPFCKAAGAATVVARRDMGFWYTPANLRLLRVSNRFVDAVVANCQAVKLNVNKHEGYPLDRTHVLPNGHHPARFAGHPDPFLRRELGIDRCDPVIGMVANFRPIKRHTDVLTAFALMRQQHPRCHLLLVGNGQLQDDLHHFAQQQGLAGWVHFVSNSTDVVPYIKLCDVCLLASASEGLSNAVLEYLACGKPTVATNRGGTPELIQQGRNGFLIDPGDINALAHHVSSLLSNPQLRKTMSEAAARTFAESFTTDRMVAAHMQLYEGLLGRN
jgi:glycosyltransferase involved in cell wall biosynthesis